MDYYNKKLTISQYYLAIFMTFGQFLYFLHYICDMLIKNKGSNVSLEAAMKEKVLKNKQLKLEKLLSSAQELFMSKGIQDTSVSDITSYAGVAKGTFYLYFADKYSIRDHLIALSSHKLFHSAHIALTQQEDIRSFEDKILFIVDHIILELADNKPLLAFISKNLSWGLFQQMVKEDIQEDNLTGLQMFEGLAAECSIKLKDPDIMAFIIIELTSSTTHSALLGKDPIPLEKLMPYLNDTIRGIIRNHIVEDED